MENKKKLNSIEKIEEMFLEDIALLQSEKSPTKSATLKRITIKQLLSIPSFFVEKDLQGFTGSLERYIFLVLSIS